MKNTYIISMPFYISRDKAERGRTPNSFFDIEVRADSEAGAIEALRLNLCAALVSPTSEIVK